MTHFYIINKLISTFVFSLLLVFGITSNANSKILPPTINKELRDPFPAAPKELLENAKFRTEETKTSEYTKGRLSRKSSWNVKYVRHVETPKVNAQKVVFTLESAVQEVSDHTGKKYVLNIEGFHGASRIEKINLKLDCGWTQEKTERGLKEGFAKLISNEITSERKAFLEEIASLAMHNSTSCKSTKFIPIDPVLSEAKLPGESWITNPDVPGFGASELKSTFVGWHVDGLKKSMVLEAKSSGAMDAQQDGQTVRREYTNNSRYIIDSDWKNIRVINDLDIEIKTKLETSTVKSHTESSSKKL